ncbi:hypothetical protein IDH44_21505 [Paenibacillus sp. IB182496]|uniref:Uncharacterized protein n=1 Tax=Paenibacillus sabuli TaxID=2772509 RepID=A0A927BYR8_9BACL|nr:hypothetical protein [Paenibacillus sabuli]MBD2847778.1 hypothetical protein [Paenibacillus sabuli]
MYKLLLLPLLMAVLMLLQALQLDQEMAVRILYVGKHAINRAAHAAAQQLDQERLANGELRIDREAAAAAAARYLQFNMNLDAHGEPLAGSPFQGEVEVLRLEVVDGNRPYPVRYRLPEYDYEVMLYGPSVVLVVQIDYPRAFSVLDPITWQVKGAAELVR